MKIRKPPFDETEDQTHFPEWLRPTFCVCPRPSLKGSVPLPLEKKTGLRGGVCAFYVANLPVQDRLLLVCSAGKQAPEPGRKTAWGSAGNAGRTRGGTMRGAKPALRGAESLLLFEPHPNPHLPILEKEGQTREGVISLRAHA